MHALLAFALVPGTLASTNAIDKVIDRDFAVFAVQGFGTPVGHFGVIASVVPIRMPAALELGVGTAYTGVVPYNGDETFPKWATQWSAMLRGFLSLTSSTLLSFGLGGGGGRHATRTGVEFAVERCEPNCAWTSRFWRHAVRANGEMAFEWRPGLLAIRTFAGASYVLNDATQCIEDGGDCSRNWAGYGRFYVGGAIGVTF